VASDAAVRGLKADVARLRRRLAGNPASVTGQDLLRPIPHLGQASFLASDAPRRVLVAHRRWGKDWVTCLDILWRVREWRKEPHRRKLVPGVSVAVVYPTHSLLAEFWQTLKRLVPQDEVVKALEAPPRRLELKGDVSIICLSGDDPERLIAGGHDYIIYGEAGALDAAVWEYSQPMLAAPGRSNLATFAGTPRGANWFQRLYQRAADPLETDWAAWRIGFFDEQTGERHPLSNPHIDEAIVEQERREMSARWFAQEWLASFLTSEGAVFRDVRARIAAPPANPKQPIIAGLDLARRRDFTALAIFDGDGRQLDLLRIRELQYQSQAQAITAALGRWGVKKCVVEQNSIGDPFTELLEDALAEQHVKCKLLPFVTTSQSKRQAIEGLVVAFERSAITLLNDEVQANEFEAYSASQTALGTETFSAPSGMHDDCVMSCALAFSELRPVGRGRGMGLSSAVHIIGRPWNAGPVFSDDPPYQTEDETRSDRVTIRRRSRFEI
jgi:hypothetical protein